MLRARSCLVRSHCSAIPFGVKRRSVFTPSAQDQREIVRTTRRQKKHKISSTADNSDNIWTSYKVPFTPKGSSSTEQNEEFGWDLAREEMMATQDSLTGKYFEKDIDEEFAYNFLKGDSIKFHPESEKILADSIAELPTPTVAEDFNERQSKLGNYGGFSGPARGGFNPQERDHFQSWKDYRDPHYLSVFYSLLRIKEKQKRVPSIPEIAFELLNPGPSPLALNFDRQRNEALRIAAKEMDDPETIKEEQTPPVPFSNFDKHMGEIYQNESDRNRKFSAFTIYPISEMKVLTPTDLELVNEEDPNQSLEDTTELEPREEISAEGERDNNADVDAAVNREGFESENNLDSDVDREGMESEGRVAEASDTEPEEPEREPQQILFGAKEYISGLDALYQNLGADYSTQKSKHVRIAAVPRVRFATDQYEDPTFFVKSTPFDIGEHCQSRYFKERRRLVTGDNFQGPFTFEKLGSPDFTTVEQKPYQPDGDVVFVDLAGDKNYLKPNRETLRNAERIQEALVQDNGSNREQIIYNLMHERTGGISREDPLAFLADIQTALDKETEEKQAQRKAQAKEERRIRREAQIQAARKAREEEELREQQAKEEEAEENVKNESEELSETETEDEFAQLEKIMGDDRSVLPERGEDEDSELYSEIYAPYDVSRDETPEKAKELDKIEEQMKEKKDRFRIPYHDEVDIDKVLENGGTTRDIQRAFERFLLGKEIADSLPGEENIIFKRIEMKNEGVISAFELLKKMKKAYGDQITPKIYEDAIVSYVRSDHLRYATHIMQDMKEVGMTPSVEAYTAIVEAFYSNLDLIGGDYMKNEMMIVHPNATPPSFTTNLNDDDFSNHL